jgi:hypothetical protein
MRRLCALLAVVESPGLGGYGEIGERMLKGVQRFVPRHLDLVLFAGLVVDDVDGDGVALRVPAKDDF